MEKKQKDHIGTQLSLITDQKTQRINTQPIKVKKSLPLKLWKKYGTRET